MIGARALAGLAALGAAGAGHCQSATRQFWVQGLVHRPSIDTTARISNQAILPGDPGIDFEQTFRFPDRDALPSVTVGARIGRNWRLVGDVFSLDRQQTATLSDQIEFDGVTYPADGRVSARFGSDIYRLAVGYSFLDTPKLELGASLGAHVTSFVVALDGVGSIGNDSGSLQARRRRVLAPLPTLGLYAEWRPAQRWLIAARADALRLKIDRYDGRLLNLQASATYEVLPDLAVGLAWRRVSYRLDVAATDWSGRLRYRFDGPAALVEWRFGRR